MPTGVRHVAICWGHRRLCDRGAQVVCRREINAIERGRMSRFVGQPVRRMPKPHQFGQALDVGGIAGGELPSQALRQGEKAMPQKSRGSRGATGVAKRLMAPAWAGSRGAAARRPSSTRIPGLIGVVALVAARSKFSAHKPSPCCFHEDVLITFWDLVPEPYESYPPEAGHR